ncbi:MAG: vWA domain-containing protein, partial [Opitutales bacterium]
ILLKSSHSTQEQHRTVFIAIDQSISMEHRSGGKTALQRAVGEAERVLDTLRADDKLNILAVGNDIATAFPTPSSNKSTARQFLSELSAGTGGANFSNANHQMGGMAFEAGETSTEIFYISDFQRTNWDNVDFRALPATARVFFVDVGSKNRSNRAVNGMQIEGKLVAGGMITAEVTVANFSSEGKEEQVQILIDGRPATTASLYIAPYSLAKAKVPFTLGSEGIHLIQAKIPHDDLEEDDSLNAVVHVSEKEEVLLLARDSEELKDRGVDYLEAALNPFIGNAGSIRPRRLPAESAGPADFAAVTKVFLSQIGSIDEAAAKQLAEFIFSGGGVVWFLDGPDDANNLALLGQFIGSEGAALQLGSWDETESLANARQIMTGDFDSPFLKLFTGTRLQDLGRLEVYDNYSAAATSIGKTLLGFSDGSPAMTEQTYGMGQLVLINFSPNTKHSNLAKQRFFPIWIQEMVNAFGGEQSSPIYLTSGQRAQSKLWKNDVSQYQFRSPDGREIQTRVEVMGQRANVSFPLSQLGIYQLNAGDKLVSAFAVNPPPIEADLRPLDMEDLPSRDDTPESSTLLEGTTTDFTAAVFGHPLFPWFIGAALLCLLAELALHELVYRNRPTVIKE